MKLTLFAILLLRISLQALAQVNIDLNVVLPVSQGLQISGGAPSAYLGFSVSSAGDVNGDGIDDIIIGAANASPLGRSNAGAAYVIYGKDGGIPAHIDLVTPLSLSQGFQILGAVAGDKLGSSVGFAGDVNGDGVADIIVGAPDANPSAGRLKAGIAYVIYGKIGGIPADIDLSTALSISQGVQILGAYAADSLGISAGFAGDMNKDGLDDIIVGAYSFDASGRTNAGAAYVIYGKLNGLTANLDLMSSLPLSQGFSILGAAQGDSLGFSVSWAGDVNGDGIDDIIVGARNAELSSSIISTGAAYVIYGQNGPFSANIDLITGLSLSTGFAIYGRASFDNIANDVKSAGDINNDGVDDVIVGAQAVGSGAGAAYIIYGKNGGHTAHINLANPFPSSLGFQILGGALYDSLGCSVNSAGDVNLDGIDDIIVGAHSADPVSRTDAGVVYVIYGQTGGFSADIDLSNSLSPTQGFKISGGAAGDGLGRSVSSVGDINNDGSADIIIGASSAGPSGRSNAGSAYVIYSSCNLPNCAQCSGSKCLNCEVGYVLNSGDHKCYIPPPASPSTPVIEPTSSTPSSQEDVGESMKLIDTVQSSASDVALLAASTITLVEFINPGGFLFVALAELLQYMKYMSISCPPRLKYLIKEQGSDRLFSVEYITSAPPELEDGIEKYNLADNFERNKLHSSFLVNFWSSLVTFLMIGIAIVMISWLAWLTRNSKAVNLKLLKMKEALKWNYLLGTIIGCYRAVSFFTALEIRSIQFGSSLGILSFILCLVTNVVMIVISIKLIRIIKKLTREKDATQRETLKQNFREYRILFESSKDGSFTYQGYFLFACLRLYVFYLILGYLFEHPVLQAILINTQGLAFLFYLLIKRPLKAKLDLVEALVLEFLLQIVHACVLGLTIIDQTEYRITDAAVFLGDIVIICNGILLLVGWLYLVIQIFKVTKEVLKFIKEYCTRNKSVSSAKVTAVKPSQVEVDSSIRNSQIDLSMMNDSHRPMMSQHLQNGQRNEVLRPRYQRTLVDTGSHPSTLMDLTNEDSQIKANNEGRREIMKQRILAQNSSLMTRKVSVAPLSRSITGDLTMMNESNDISIPNLKKLYKVS